MLIFLRNYVEDDGVVALQGEEKLLFHDGDNICTKERFNTAVVSSG